MACECKSGYTRSLADLGTACIQQGCTSGNNHYTKTLIATKTMTCTKLNSSSYSEACTVNAGCCS
ncbi:hypothetical protein D3C77_457120 [compost metagenome]